MDLNEATQDFIEIFRFNFTKKQFQAVPIKKEAIIKEDMPCLNSIKAILDGIVLNELMLEIERISNDERLSAEEKECQIKDLTEFVDSGKYDPFHYHYKNAGNHILLRNKNNQILLCEYKQEMYSFFFYLTELPDFLDSKLFDLSIKEMCYLKSNPLFKIVFEYKENLIQFYGEELNTYTRSNSIH